MSCDGCVWAGKNAGCDFTYICNTGGRPVAKKEHKDETGRKKKKAE